MTRQIPVSMWKRGLTSLPEDSQEATSNHAKAEDPGAVRVTSSGATVAGTTVAVITVAGATVAGVGCRSITPAQTRIAATLTAASNTAAATVIKLVFSFDVIWNCLFFAQECKIHLTDTNLKLGLFVQVSQEFLIGARLGQALKHPFGGVG